MNYVNFIPTLDFTHFEIKTQYKLAKYTTFWLVYLKF